MTQREGPAQAAGLSLRRQSVAWPVLLIVPAPLTGEALVELSAVDDDSGGHRGFAFAIPADDPPGRRLEVLPLDLATLAGVCGQDAGSARLGPVTPGMTSRCTTQLTSHLLTRNFERKRLVWGIQRSISALGTQYAFYLAILPQVRTRRGRRRRHDSH